MEASTGRAPRIALHRRFNGATTMVSWNGGSTVSAAFGERRAAAFQWGHDDGVVEWCLTKIALGGVAMAGFNGATTMESWNGRHRRLHVISSAVEKLQWGHDDGVVEWIAERERVQRWSS